MDWQKTAWATTAEQSRPHVLEGTSTVRVLGAVLLCFIGILFTPAVKAGGGPETTLLVINAESPASLQVANAYAQLRDLPDSHLLWLQGVPSRGIIDLETFRTRIWRPIRAYLADTGLDGVIDTIAYSADFPYGVNFSADIKAHQLPRNKYRGQVASLTGLTYYGRRVEIGDIGYLGINQYFRRNLSARLCAAGSRPPDATEQALQKQAQGALKKRDYPVAVEAYEAFTDSYPWSGHSWYHLARGLAAMEQPEAALEALSRAVDTCWTNSLQARSDRYLKRLQGHPAFASLLERMEAANGPFQAAHGFRSHYVWSGRTLPERANPSESLDRYYLSTLLAYTGERGNSVPEVLDYLASAAVSDGSQPAGTVYLLQNPNVRSETRQPLFLSTVAELEKRGRRAEILARGRDGQNGIVPKGRDDVIGLVAGTRRFDWERSDSRFLPGAIAESLTSYGGHFNHSSQTKLSEFLRHGAAGSSGAVNEPFSFQAKFPVPLLHVYYADGSSLAEAFYQSIAAPYQLIVVGDPLARPFAHFAQVALAAPNSNAPWQGVIHIRPRLIPAWQRPIGRVELWVNGRHVADALPGETILWDTRTVEDGSHELRLVAVEAGRIETRSYTRVQTTVANTANHLAVDAFKESVLLGEDIRLAGSSPGGWQVELFQGHRMLGSVLVAQGRWQLTLDSRLLGVGRVTLTARGEFADGSTVRSAPIEIDIREPTPVHAKSR